MVVSKPLDKCGIDTLAASNAKLMHTTRTASRALLFARALTVWLASAYYEWWAALEGGAAFEEVGRRKEKEKKIAYHLEACQQEATEQRKSLVPQLTLTQRLQRKRKPFSICRGY